MVAPSSNRPGATFGWHQILFYDPEGDVIEVHQDMNG
jgi:hypothetical protein